MYATHIHDGLLCTRSFGNISLQKEDLKSGVPPFDGAAFWMHAAPKLTVEVGHQCRRK